MINEKDGLEIKRVKMVDDEGNIIGITTALSIVSDPANELQTLFLKREGDNISKDGVLTNFAFKVTSEERKEITGAALVPNQLIKREHKDKEGNGLGTFYYIYFTEEDVRAAHDYYRMFADDQSSNPEHFRKFSDKFRSTQSWIIEDEVMDKANFLGLDMSKHPKGTWMHTFKVLIDDEGWADLKKSGLNGFSPELAGFVIDGDLKLSAEAETIEAIEPIKVEPEVEDSLEEQGEEYEEYTNQLYQTIRAIVFDKKMDNEMKYRVVHKILNQIKRNFKNNN